MWGVRLDNETPSPLTWERFPLKSRLSHWPQTQIPNFNGKTVNNLLLLLHLLLLFLSPVHYQSDLPGHCWIKAKVLFTDDWLETQNHKIIFMVTFITVIFKLTATCSGSEQSLWCRLCLWEREMRGCREVGREPIVCGNWGASYRLHIYT